MKTNKEMLSSLLKTTQMGQVGIRSVMEYAGDTALRSALHSQLTEYDRIETEAHAIAAERGWTLPELAPGIRMMTDMMTRFQLTTAEQDSKIPDMMIIGNTKGLVKGYQNLHRQTSHDEAITDLTRKLLSTEQANIQQMQGFL